MKRYQKRNNARQALKKLMNEKGNILFIHYSCESFYGREGLGSHRITSIAVRHYVSGQTVSFSLSKYAEIAKIPHDKIDENYDQLEKEMLSEFYKYVESHKDYKWVHWNMRDENYGFPAIALRYKVLGGDPPEIHHSNLYDLSKILVKLFGDTYIGHPRLEKIITHNSITDTGFISGAQEAEAFENKEFIKLHQSTLRKVECIEIIFDKTLSETLKHEAKFKEIYGGVFTGAMHYIKEHPAFVIISLIAAIISIIGYFFPFNTKG